MPGSLADPVQLDHFQNIVEVGWHRPASEAHYLLCHTVLRSVQPQSASFGLEFSGVGIEPLVGRNYHDSYLTGVIFEYLRASFVDNDPEDYPAKKFKFDSLWTQNGEFAGSEGTFSVLGAPALPMTVPPTGSFARGGPAIGSDSGGIGDIWRELTGAPIDLPFLADVYQPGPAYLDCLANQFESSTPGEYNPTFPTPISNYPLTAPVLVPPASIATALSLEVGLTAAFVDGLQFEPIGFALKLVQIGLQSGHRARVLCRKV